MPSQLNLLKNIQCNGARLLMSFTGWMDGGDVSTGTVAHLRQSLDAEPVAEIWPDDFYIMSFPGSMEVAAMFRPHLKIEDGTIQELQLPKNTFHCSAEQKLILFEGREPNINWPLYADCMFTLARDAGVKGIYFIGSVAGLVPHTREPRIFGSVSEARLKKPLRELGLRFTNYEGPGSFVSYLMTQAPKYQLPMVTVVAEIPAYSQGGNPKAIHSMAKKLAALLNIVINTDELSTLSESWEAKLSEAVAEREELVNHVKKLEEDYDNEVFDSQMDDLKDLLHRQGIRLD